MDDPNRPSNSNNHHQQQQQQQQQYQHNHNHNQQQHLHQNQDHDNQQASQTGADLIEATISSLLSSNAAKISDYHEILPKFSSQLKTDFENRNLWLRFGLTIELSKQCPQSALQAFIECMRIDQDDPLPAMLAAKLFLDELDDPEQAVKVACEAISRCKKQIQKNTVGISDNTDSLDDNSSNEIISRSHSTSSKHSSSECTIIQTENSNNSHNHNQPVDQQQTDNLVDQQQEKPNIEMVSSIRYKNIAPILSRCYILASIAHAYLYEREPESIRLLFKESNLKTSLELLDLAQETNPQDHLIYFHRALHEAKQRIYPKAMDNLRRAIKINPNHVPSIQLLILCLSALKLRDEALNLCDSILKEREDDLMLLYIKCKLEQSLIESKGYKVALSTAQHMLKCIRLSMLCKSCENAPSKNYSSATTISATTLHPGTQNSRHPSSTNVTATSTSATANNLVPSNVSGTATLTNNSLRVSTTNSVNNNSTNLPLTLSNPAGDTKQVSNLFADDSVESKSDYNYFSTGELSIWILVAEIFVKIGSVEDAEMCVDEASVHANGALSHRIMYIRGLIAKTRGQLIEAKTFFQSCLALSPKHALALQQIAHVHHLLGNHSTAEKFLRDSLDLDGNCYKTWHYLSLVYGELNQQDRANECVKKSTALKETSPSVPFSAISRLTLQ